MILDSSKIIEIFYIIDEYWKQFEPEMAKRLLAENNGKKTRKRASALNQSELMTILVLFHIGGYKNLKHFYLNYICKHMRSEFPNVLSYSRFVSLQKRIAFPMACLLKSLMKPCTGISFIDSTPLRVCRNQRIHSHKVFRDLAQRGKCSMGWFYGFKLHIVINEKGELLNFMVTSGNTDDREPLKSSRFIKDLFGKMFGDKGYISKTLSEFLFIDGIQMVTKLKSNMKNMLMSLEDRLLLRKRALIETVNDELKNICQIEHSRHRSPINFLNNLLGGLIAYSFFPKKPAIRFVSPDTKEKQLSLLY